MSLLTTGTLKQKNSTKNSEARICKLININYTLNWWVTSTFIIYVHNWFTFSTSFWDFENYSFDKCKTIEHCDYQLTTFGSVSLLPVSLLRILKTPGTIKITRVCFNWLVI